MNANPTQGQLLHQEYQQKKEQLKDMNKVSILAKYGGEEYLEKAPKELLLGQTEEYVEFSRTGRVIKGKERAMVRSKYPEDGMSLHCDPRSLSHAFSVYVNNHTAVWGSWYDMGSGEWGYACCHSIVHLSYCTGEAGKEAAHASSAKNLLKSTMATSTPPPENVPASSAEDRKKKAEELFSKARLGEGEIVLDKDRLAEAISDERKRKGRGEDGDDRFGKRQKGSQGGSHEVTQEELGEWVLFLEWFCILTTTAEAYRMNRRMTEDPMANYKDTDF